ncbi:MAG TPA: AsmA family protein, partial [Clostridia bacterium]|nr:AsmA family protein [Clostridia bacterium]
MTETNATSAPGPRKGRSWLRIIGWLAAVCVVLIVAVYFVATSGAFLKGVILPRVSTAMKAKITVGDASISPFRQVILKDLRLQPEGQEPLLTAAEVRLRYSLLPMLKGNYNVELVSVQSPVVQLVENPDGSSNLDPILKAQEEQAPQPGQPEPAEPMNVEIKKVTINNGTVRYVKLYDANHRDVAEVTALNTTLENLKNDFTGKMSFDGRMNVQNNPPAPGTNGTVQGRLDGSYTFSLTRDLG